ncbi:hypothetical protein O181_030476 [Austropuccinia psidii MF-1]|uniref:Uncharacterized protein n=1 Tax=Austropuccinia psidii MF-1 TaxID=1389203 RepID=A0A9Q3CYJ4_9BASI|nr:hypothetical protein [Austropuccinia psidii MF-1]
MHLFSPEIQWCQYKMDISKSHPVIKESRHPEDSSRLNDKCQSQIPMMPSSNHWSFSFKVFLQRNTCSSFSRDIQEAVTKQFAKGQCSINPPWQPHSFNTVWIHQYLYFQPYTMGISFNPVNFPTWQGTPFIKQSIQTSCQPERLKLSIFYIYQPPLTLGFSPS